jgi:hypothetical protein
MKPPRVKMISIRVTRDEHARLAREALDRRMSLSAYAAHQALRQLEPTAAPQSQPRKAPCT